ncbi:unnamed protein product, partial [Symbiodinium sp. CCMP2456]
VTILHDDTNVFLNQDAADAGLAAEQGKKSKRGSLKRQSLMGMVQRVFVRRDEDVCKPDASGETVQIHVPRGWGELACGRFFKLCTDACPANFMHIAAEHHGWNQLRASHDLNACGTMNLEVNCLHHQACLARRPIILYIDGLAASTVRLAKAMRGSKFQQSIEDGIGILVNKMDRIEVAELPESVKEFQEKQDIMLTLAAGSSLTSDQRKLVLRMFNGNWESARDNWQQGEWTHWCCSGCCASEEISKRSAREALPVLFQAFASEPLLYRWKHWEPFLEWVLRGIVVNGFLKFLITQCAPKDEKDRADWDEGDPAMSFAEKQAVRVSKCQKALTEPDFHVILFKALISAQPLRQLMDDVSLVETLRVRFMLKQKGVKLENSAADASVQNIRNKNWVFYSGERALTTLQDFTQLLLMAEEVTSLTGLHFQELFPLLVRAMTDSHRRMYYMTQKLSYKLLAVFKMSLQEACGYIERLWQEYKSRPCCLDPHFSQVAVGVRIVPNPAPECAPKLFRPCADCFAGVCQSSKTHADVMRMTAQFQTMLVRSKLGAGSLFKFRAFVPPRAEEASAGSGGFLSNTVTGSWWVLGCTSLRPLAHVFLKVHPVAVGASTLAPVIDQASMRATVGSSMEIFEFYAKAARARGMDPEAHICSYEYVPEYTAAHGNCLTLCSDAEHPIHVGAAVELPPQKNHATPHRATPVLPFGIVPQTAAPPRRGRGGRGGKGGRSAGGAGGGKRPSPAAAAGDQPNPSDADDLQMQLSESQLQELEQAVVVEASATSESASGSASASASGLQEDVESPRVLTSAAAASSSEVKAKFNHTLGLVGYGVVKRRCKCTVCNGAIIPGDMKFELATHLQKPSKSIHTTCVTAMPATLQAPSSAWLQRQVSKPDIAEFEKELYERSLHDLQMLDSINRRSAAV